MTLPDGWKKCGTTDKSIESNCASIWFDKQDKTITIDLEYETNIVYFPPQVALAVLDDNGLNDTAEKVKRAWAEYMAEEGGTVERHLEIINAMLKADAT